MSSETRYVFDSNVIISAMLFSDSVPGQAFSQSLDRGTILLSHTLAKELSDVLGRAKFNWMHDGMLDDPPPAAGVLNLVPWTAGHGGPFFCAPHIRAIREVKLENQTELGW